VCIIAYVHLKKQAAENGDIELPPWALETAAEPAGPTLEDDRPAKYKPKKINKIKKK
jgi:hypothetical protein